MWHVAYKRQDNPEGRKADLVARTAALIAQRFASLREVHAGIPYDLFALEVQKVLDEIKNAR